MGLLRFVTWGMKVGSDPSLPKKINVLKDMREKERAQRLPFEKNRGYLSNRDKQFHIFLFAFIIGDF